MPPIVFFIVYCLIAIGGGALIITSFDIESTFARFLILGITGVTSMGITSATSFYFDVKRGDKE